MVVTIFQMSTTRMMAVVLIRIMLLVTMMMPVNNKKRNISTTANFICMFSACTSCVDELMFLEYVGVTNISNYVFIHLLVLANLFKDYPMIKYFNPLRNISIFSFYTFDLMLTGRDTLFV